MLQQHQSPSLMVVVSAETLAGVQRSIHACEICSENATVPLTQLLDRLVGHFAFEREYVLNEDISCPECASLIDNETLVELHCAARQIATAHA